MAEKTKIEWCDATVNFWWGCRKVSPACANCYAEGIARRFHPEVEWVKIGGRFKREREAYRELLLLAARSLKVGKRRRVFINSMSDTFEDHPVLCSVRSMLWHTAECCSNLDILLLTKRPENVMRMVPNSWRENWPAHVWIGTTVENQEMADKRIPELLKIPAGVRFLSCEPLLGAVHIFNKVTGDLEYHSGDYFNPGSIDWIIAGGESGANARPMHPDWVRDLHDQCVFAHDGVPFFFKGWGEWVPVEECGFDTCRLRGDTGLSINGKTPATLRCIDVDGKVPDVISLSTCTFARIGKKAAGHLLDGVAHREFPEVKR